MWNIFERIVSTKSGYKRKKTANRLGVEPLESRRLLAVTTAVQSGAWGDANTWSAGVPDSTTRAIIPPAVTVTLTGTSHVTEELVVQGILDVEESPGVDKSLTSDWIHVNSGGVFQIGTEANRYDANDFTITLTGEEINSSFNIEGVGTVNNNNAFLMVGGGGRLQFFGEERLTFTRLAATANQNSNQILVEQAIDRNHDGSINAADGSLNWEVGDQIVIASSTDDYRDEDVRFITAISDQGDGTSLITLNTPLNNRHYGEIESYGDPVSLPGDFNLDNIVDAADFTIWQDNLGASDESALNGNGDGFGGVDFADYGVWRNNFGETGQGGGELQIDLRAEVAVLNRNVKIQGLASHDTDNQFGDRNRFNAGVGDGFGGHTMIMASAGQITVDSVQFDRMGQTSRLGRYPIHWHIAGDRSGDILRGASITNSNNRGLTVHGTHNLLIEGVVLHDIHGHGFFMEDGVETGNEFISNIAFGIHKVGRSDAVGQFAPDLNDPFIVDTHDHVGQNGNRFLSSAAYWITNPDNTWVGNVSAGSEGTGFWFILPRRPIGAAATDPQYNGVNASRTNLRQFDFNSSHASPIGLNFDRGSDVELPVGAQLLPFFDGRPYEPPSEPQINNYTAYKHRIGIYHRGEIANFHENLFADNFNSTFLTFTQRVTDSLYVGNSRGNADFSSPVSGHSIYDGAGTLDGNHFAGFAANNAHTFRTHGAERRHTSYVARNTSFEDDGSANNVSVANPNGGANHSEAVGGFSAAAIYDEDGTLTGHVGGGPGSTVVTNNRFFYDSDDIRPPGWNAWVSDDIYALLNFNPVNQSADFRITTPDGDSETESGRNFNTHVKTDNGDYTISFPEGTASVANGFRMLHYIRTGPSSGSTVMRFSNVGNLLAPLGVPRVNSLNALRNSNSSAYAVVNGDLWMNAYSSANQIEFVNVAPSPTTLWQDNSPLSGISQAGSSISVNTVNGSVTGDGSRGNVGAVTLNGSSRFESINAGDLNISPQFQGLQFSFTVDYFIPNGTTLDGPDSVYVQINFNGNNSGSAGFVGLAEAGTGWNTITLTGDVPNGTISATPLIIVADGGFGNAQPNGNGQGVAFYVDDIEFTVGIGAATRLTGAEFPLDTPVKQATRIDSAPVDRETIPELLSDDEPSVLVDWAGAVETRREHGMSSAYLRARKRSQYHDFHVFETTAGMDIQTSVDVGYATTADILLIGNDISQPSVLTQSR